MDGDRLRRKNGDLSFLPVPVSILISEESLIAARAVERKVHDPLSSLSRTSDDLRGENGYCSFLLLLVFCFAVDCRTILQSQLLSIPRILFTDMHPVYLDISWWWWYYVDYNKVHLLWLISLPPSS